MSDVTPTKETIDTFYVCADQHEVDDEPFQHVSLWVRHEGGFEYPMLSFSEMWCFNSADPNFNDTERNEVGDTFYRTLAEQLLRLVDEGEHVVHDCWVWMPDELDGPEQSIIHEILHSVATGFFIDDGLSFEVEELLERGLEVVESEMDAREVALDD